MNLRKANISNLSQVRAVVMETTGEVTVIAHQPDGPTFGRRQLNGVRAADLVEDPQRSGADNVPSPGERPDHRS